MGFNVYKPKQDTVVAKVIEEVDGLIYDPEKSTAGVTIDGIYYDFEVSKVPEVGDYVVRVGPTSNYRLVHVSKVFFLANYLFSS